MPRNLLKPVLLGAAGLAASVALVPSAVAQPSSGLTPDQADAVASRLSEAQSVAKVSRYGTRLFQDTLGQRNALVTGQGQIAGLQDLLSQPNLVAQSGGGAELAVFDEAPFQSGDRPAMGLWFSGYGQQLEQDSKYAGFTPFEADSYGGALGHDWSINDKGYAGVAIGYNDSNVEFDGRNAESDITSFLASFYSGWTDGQASVHGSAVYARHTYERGVLEREGDEWAADIEVAYDLTKSQAHWLSPFWGFEFSELTEESHSIRAGGTTQRVANRETRSLRSLLGLKAGHRWETSSRGVLSLWTSLGYSYDFDLDDDIQAGSVNLNTTPDEEHGGQLKLGLSYGRRDSYVIGIEAIGESREDFDAYGGQFVFRKVVY